ncbi:MAG: hypothetical protein ACTSRP_04060 [Candidatus Helarchaeota archaeon]
MHYTIESEKKNSKKKKNNLLLEKIKQIKFILDVLEDEIKKYDYDKITDSITSLNMSINAFFNELKEL